MKTRTFEFNLRELAGSMGDFGTLFPLAIGYIAICGLDPTGLLVMMGLANIVTGLVYRLPMPIEPMKVIAVMAIAQHWSPSMVYASAFSMGIIWLVLAITGIMALIARYTPLSVTRGIQVSLGIILALEAFKMLSTWWVLGIISIVIVLLLRENKYAPAAIVLMILGILVMFFKGQLYNITAPAFQLPGFTNVHFTEIWDTLVRAGFAQVPLTATNAVIATAALIKSYWPDRTISETKLSLNMGIINMVSPFFGGMPLCHGAGGLAGQYYFGARTGGTNIIEGMIEISLGIFFAASIAGLLQVFPTAIIGAMMFLIGIELTKFVKDIRPGKDLIPLGVTVITSLATNMALGFLAGLAAHYLMLLRSPKGVTMPPP
jgi:xanthine/uracil/vitamin C permease (AzgA family)